MDVLVTLIALALCFAGGAAVVFVRSVSLGQFDDLETPRHRILADEDEIQR